MTKRHSTKAGLIRHKGKVLSLFALAAALFPLSPALAGVLTAVEVSGNDVTLSFNGPGGEAAALALGSPNRIAIDVAGHSPGAPVQPTGGAVRSVRQGRMPGNGVRIVLDLNGPMGVGPMHYSPDGRQIYFRIAPGLGSEQALSPILGQMPTLAMARMVERRYSVTVPIGTPATSLPLPSIDGPNNPALPLVVVDAGHGGHDPGAISPDGRYREEDVTLAIARRVRDALVASGRVRVALTRDSDRFLVLEERYGLARRLGADLFISIHADSAENTGATGASIYTLSETASDREASRLAARENRANILNGIDLGGENADVRSILIDLAQRETMNLSVDFARTLQRTAGSDIPFRQAALRHAGFVVLKAPDMPSVLLETGFISNNDDAARLASASGQNAIARGVREAVLTHFARRLDNGAGTTTIAARR